MKHIKKFNEELDHDYAENAKIHLRERFQKIIDTDDELRIEDGGAVIVETDFFNKGDGGVHLTFTSWGEEEMKHPWFEEQYKLFKKKIS
jgi:hypothetical protein